MTQYLYPLRRRDVLTLTGLILCGFVWLKVDQYILPEVQHRFFALIVLLFTLFFIQFLVNRPMGVIRYCNSIALITVSFAIISSVVMHAIIDNDFSYKAILIWLIAGALPYIAGIAYKMIRKPNVL